MQSFHMLCSFFHIGDVLIQIVYFFVFFSLTNITVDQSISNFLDLTQKLLKAFEAETAKVYICKQTLN